jgi:hypothetical protein
MALVARRDDPVLDAAKAVAVAPLVLPFAVAILFGNMDAWYGLAFGALVLGVAVGPVDRNRAIVGGILLGAVTVAKLHPASLLAWLGARAIVDRKGPATTALAAACATGIAIVGVSLLVGGIGPWQDYVGVVRAGMGAAVVDARNVGPVSLLGQLVALDSTGVRLAQAVVSLAALVVTVLAAVRLRDPLASLAIAIAASLVVLPVTWYHYPVALIAVGIALALWRPAARTRLATAAVVADLSIAFVPLLWLAVGLLLSAGRPLSRDRLA